MKNKRIIPVFYACDDDFIKYAAVSLRSIIANASPSDYYEVHFLVTAVTENYKQTVLKMQNENCKIVFDNVEPCLKELSKNLPLRDYFSKTTYYRLFIADMFPQYDKAIYIDGDTIVTADLGEFYSIDLKDNFVGAIPERVMRTEDIFGTYVENVLGIDRYAYFNAGVLLIDCKKTREAKMLEKFGKLLTEYDFLVTQDEDYLNILCKDRVLLISPEWNAEVYFGLPVASVNDAKILHYIMSAKPWRGGAVEYSAPFWKYAEQTDFYNLIVEETNACDLKAIAAKNEEALARLKKLALSEIEREDNYLKNLRKKQDFSRVEVLNKISELEKNGVFDKDVENDPPTKPLTAKVDYAQKKLISKVKSKMAFGAARIFLNDLLKSKKMIIKDIIGAENLRSVEGGAILTCNHFNAYDSFAMQVAYETCDTKKHKFFRVVREGNYTSFNGFFGYLMKNCNTLPLSGDVSKMKEFYDGVSEILKNKGFILIYAEQSMWWNYRKPKPLKKGAFSLASANNAPIVPCFITMRDGDEVGADGFKVQEYTIHVSKPIYPKAELSKGENVTYLKSENERVWKEIYEKTYGIPLTYACDEKIKAVN